jgi:hypothetical protein
MHYPFNPDDVPLIIILAAKIFGASGRPLQRQKEIQER